MTTRIDQLHYTWAPRGVEGVNQFQIAAMSEGFRTGSAAAALPMVRRLCRYDLPREVKGDPPVSFGWLDYEDQRIAFRRVGLPAEMGKRGNFAAHFLVAPSRALPESAIAAMFGAPFWWGGTAVGEEGEAEPRLELPALELGEIEVEADGSSEEELRAGMALAYQIFVKPEDARLGVSASADELGRAVKAVARIVPDALSGLSLSTYEGHPVFPFDLIGAEAPAPGTHQCSLAMPGDLDEEALLTLHQLADGSRLGRVASHVSRDREGTRAAAIWKTAREIFGLSRGEEAKGAEGLLADSGVVGFICGTAEGRAAVAAAAHRGNASVLAAVASSVAAMDESEAGLLAAAIAERCRSTREVARCAAVSAALGEAGGVVLDTVLDLALEDEEVGASLGDEDAVLILARASERGIKTAEAHPLLRGARHRIDSCASDPRVPVFYLAAMFGFGLEDLAAAPRLVAAARARPELLQEVQLDGAEKERCLQLLQRLDSMGRQVLLPAFLGQLAEEQWGGQLCSIVRSLPGDVAACCVLDSLRGEEGAMPPVLAEICESLAVDLLASDGVALALRLLRASDTVDARRAVRLVQDMGHGSSTSAAVAIEAEAELGASALGVAIAELAIGRAVAAVEGPSDVASAWMAINTSESQDDEAALRRLLSLAAQRCRGFSGVEILVWIARSRVSANPKLLTVLGAIRDAKADELALEVASRVPEDLLKEREESVEPTGRSARKWWKRLQKSAAKSAE